MKKALKYLGTAVATLFTLYSCSDSKGTASDVESAPDYVMTESTDTVPIVGMVVDPSGTPLDGVLVVTGTDTTFTAKNGLYAFEKKRCVNGRSVVKFEKKGYFSVVRTAEGERLDAVLQPMEDKDNVAAVSRFKSTEATTLKVGGMTVTIPANSLVDEKGAVYSGNVSASIFYLDPNSKIFNDAMPGSDMSGVTASGKEVVLLSYGMAEVSLFDSTGGKLQLKQGAESELSFPVPAGFDDKLHKSIPLWYFDEAKGTWIEEGVAEKVDGCYKGKVQHFSWHNLDYPSSRATIQGYVRNEKGEPLPNVLVTVSQTFSYTNSEGYYSAYVPFNTPVFVTVRPVDYAGKANLPIYQVDGLPVGTVYKQDVVLPNTAYIKGRVTDTNGYGVSTVVSILPRARAISNYRGYYTLYLADDEPLTVTVLSEDYVGQKNVDIKVKPYSITSSNDIKPDFSYDFVLPVRHYGYGRVVDNNGRYVSDVNVTAKIDGKEYTSKSGLFGGYFFCYLEAKKASVGVKSDDYYGYKEVFYDLPCNKGWLSFPKIVLPAGQLLRGHVVNTCGPSYAEVTLLYGGLLKKKRESYSIMTNSFGYFELQVPFNKKKDSKQLRIKCRNKQKKVKIQGEDDVINLGDIEMCSDFPMEDNCIYVETDEKILKFDLNKDRYNEMLKSEGSNIKHQIWCKSQDYAGFLVLNAEGFCDMPYRNYTYVVSEGKYRINSYSAYLVTPNLTTYEGSYSFPLRKKVYNGDLENITFSIYDQRGDDFFVFGNVASDLVLPTTYLDKFYANYFSPNGLSGNLTSGTSDSLKFFTCKTPVGTAKQFESDLKRQKKMVEKGTFRDANDKVATVLANENEQVLIRRLSEGKWEATVLLREGIGNEPLYQCWKVDFSHSSMRTKGTAPVEYMLRNEADIVNMVMFGPLMGIKFEKTNISDNKCGCSNPPSIVPAN